MLYRPPDGSLWDTTLVQHEGWFHLFHLRGGETLGHARSRDWVQWETLAPVNLVGPAGAWNEKGAPWTGCIVRHEGRFHMLAGGPGPDGIPGYGLLVSDDLERWQLLGEQAVLAPEPPHYRREPSAVHFMHAAWRDPMILQDAAGWYHAFLCARRPAWSADDTGTIVAHARSRDLRQWEYLEPLADLAGRVVFAEVPDVFRLGEAWYLLLLDHGWGGTRIDTPARKDQSGTFYLRGPRMDGPYDWPAEPLLIGCSDDMVGPWAARSLAVGQQRWLYFHHNGRRKAFGLPKRIEAQPDGTLALSYLPLLEPLMTPVPPAMERPAPKPHDLGLWNRHDGGWVGQAAATGTACPVAQAVTDGEVTVRITAREAGRAGLVVRATREAGQHMFDQPSRGLAVWLDFTAGRLMLQDVAWVPGFGWGRHVGEQMGQDRGPHTLQQLALALRPGQPYGLRVLFRDEYIEVYLDDRWMLSASACPIAAGRVELALERGQARFDALAVRTLPPLA